MSRQWKTIKRKGGPHNGLFITACTLFFFSFQRGYFEFFPLRAMLCGLPRSWRGRCILLLRPAAACRLCRRKWASPASWICHRRSRLATWETDGSHGLLSARFNLHQSGLTRAELECCYYCIEGGKTPSLHSFEATSWKESRWVVSGWLSSEFHA